MFRIVNAILKRFIGKLKDFVGRGNNIKQCDIISYHLWSYILFFKKDMRNGAFLDEFS